MLHFLIALLPHPLFIGPKVFEAWAWHGPQHIRRVLTSGTQWRDAADFAKSGTAALQKW